MKRFILKKHVLSILFTLITNSLLSQIFVEQTDISISGGMDASVTWGDYDNDGDLDIMLIDDNKSKIYQNDNGVFTDINSGLVGVYSGSGAWGDYDNDGDLDIVLTGMPFYPLKISKIYRNDNGIFTDIYAGLTGVDDGSVAWGDYDNDGDLDILLTGYDSLYIQISIIYRNDAGVFTDIKAGLLGGGNGSVAWGDYDNDGDLDILLTQGDFFIPINSIIYQNNNGVFTDIKSGLVRVFYGSGEWGDYDNDGDLDILLTGNDTSIIYRNDNGVFTDINAGLIGVSNSSSAWGDYDNDGDLDILLTGDIDLFSDTSIIYQNNNGVFTDINAGLTGFSCSCVAWGDYDNDGDLDILLTGAVYPHSTKIYMNNITEANTVPAAPSNLISNVTGKGITLSWNKANDAQTGQNGLSYNLYIGNISNPVNNKSPMADLTSGYRRIVEKGAIQGNSWTIKGLTVGTYYWSVQAIDHCFTGSSFATEKYFVIPYAISVSPVTEQILAINQTGLPLTVTESNISSSHQWKYSTVSGGPYDYVIKDATGNTYTPSFSGFGTYYVVCESVYNTVTYTSNEVKINIPVFSEQKNISLAGVINSSVTWGDYDNDGDLDILLTGDTIRYNEISIIYRNDAGVFTDINAGLIGVDAGFVAWGDYDNDGDLDILLTGYNSTYGAISIIYRNDAGVFTDINAGLTGVIGSSVAWGDYDNDGDLDILLTGFFDYSSNASIIYQNNNGVFTDINAGLIGVTGGSAAWGDYDIDGDLDILLTGTPNSGPYISKIYQNDAGVFTDINARLTGVVNSSVAWGDYDNDGDLDIILNGANSAISCITKIYRNDNGIFTDINASVPYNIPGSSLAWGDYDNDGDLDILLTGTNYDERPFVQISTIYRNDAGVFNDSHVELIGVENGSVAWSDYDNDGDLDLLLTGSVGNSGYRYISKIYRNNITEVNTIPEAPSNLQANVTGTGVTLSWSKTNDAQTDQNGLSYNLYIGNVSKTVNKKSPMADLTSGYRRIVEKGAIQGNSWTIKGLTAGTYYWSVQAIDNAYAGGAWAEECSFTLWSSSIFNISTLESLLIFPNPAKTSLEVNFSCKDQGIAIINLYSSSGGKMLEYRVEKLNPELYCEIPINGLQNGIYLIEISVNNKEICNSWIEIIK